VTDKVITVTNGNKKGEGHGKTAKKINGRSGTVIIAKWTPRLKDQGAEQIT